MRVFLTLLVTLLIPLPPPLPYVWPTGGPAEVLAQFAPPAVPWGSGHRGVDLAAPEGAAILAMADGTVIFAQNLAGRGVISIEHAGGLRTTYEPVTAAVSRGQNVQGGQVIGALEAGHCEGGCLHLGARRGPDDYIDPLSLLMTVEIRLKPLGGLPRASG